MVIRQGEIYWADLGVPFGSEPGFRRPVLIVQSDLFNRTRLNTVVAVGLTSSVKRRDMPGNVAFTKGEAGLPQACAANVTQLLTLDRARLSRRIGAVSADRLQAVLDGINLVLKGVRA